MCSKRILCRLRLSGRRTLNQSLKYLLLNVSRSLSTGPSQIIETIKDLIKLLDSWMKHQTLGRLKDVVQGVYKLSQTAGVSEALESICNREMDPSSRKSLLNMIKKVARYRSSAKLLCRTAKRCPLAQAMKAVAVTPPKSAFITHNIDQTSSLDSYLNRIGTLKGGRKDLGQFCRLLQYSEQQANDQFVKQTRKTLSEAKIHAEIQLIFHCETEQYSPFPRVICSSKDACFLCNAFILMHGKFHTPRYHGRLYPGWRLPSSSEAAIYEQRFVQNLQNYAQDSIKLLLSRRKKTIYPDPNESTVLTIPITSSTLSNAAPLSEINDTITYQPPRMSNIPLVPQVVKQFAIAENVSSRLDMEKATLSPDRPRSTHSNDTVPGPRGAASTTTLEPKTGNDNCRKSKDTSFSDGEQGHDLPGSPACLKPIKLTDKDLPFHQCVTINQRPIELSHGRFVFLFEFGSVHAGQVFITQQDASHMKPSAAVNVLDIPTHSELKVGCSRGTSRLIIALSTSVFLSLEFIWGDSATAYGVTGRSTIG